jgi:hypothetical protein
MVVPFAYDLRAGMLIPNRFGKPKVCAASK